MHRYSPKPSCSPLFAVTLASATLVFWTIAVPILLRTSRGIDIADSPWMASLTGVGILGTIWLVSGDDTKTRLATLSLTSRSISRRDWPSLNLAIASMLLLAFAMRGLLPSSSGSLGAVSDIGTLVGVVLAAVLVSPVMEEVMFRGFLQSSLSVRCGFWPAALLSNLLWVSLHWGVPTYSLVTIFMLGIVLSYALLKTGNLVVCIAAHAAFNSFSSFFMIVMFFLTRG